MAGFDGRIRNREWRLFRRLLPFNCLPYRRHAREDRIENAGSRQGLQLLLDRHLASTASGFNDPRLIRIYYVYDNVCAKILIGSLPGHLPTSRS